MFFLSFLYIVRLHTVDSVIFIFGIISAENIAGVWHNKNLFSIFILLSVKYTHYHCLVERLMHKVYLLAFYLDAGTLSYALSSFVFCSYLLLSLKNTVQVTYYLNLFLVLVLKIVRRELLYSLEKSISIFHWHTVL